MPFIPFHKPNLKSTKVLMSDLQKTIKSGWISSGPEIKKFEKKFAKLAHRKFAVSVNSNTNGLHIGLKSIGVSDFIILTFL